MNKKLLILLATVVILLPIVSACGRTAPTGKPLAQPVPHAIDVRFENCNACHVNDQLNAKPLPHKGMGYTNADCTKPGCHAASTTTTTPPVTTPPVSTPPVSSGVTTPPVSTPAATLSEVGVAITTHNLAQMTGYKGLCQMCHAAGGTNSNPYPPTWDGAKNGSTANKGVYTITPGSVQDHTNYTVDQCTQAGCHAAPKA